MSKWLPRHEVRIDGTAAAWSMHYRAWHSKANLGDRGAQAAFMTISARSTQLLVRPDTLAARTDELVTGSAWAQSIARLRCLRAIDALSAAGFGAEIGRLGALPTRTDHQLPRAGAV